MKKKKFLMVCSLSTILATCLVSLNNANKDTNKNDERNVAEIMEVVDSRTILATYPTNGTSVHILKPAVLDYINAMYKQAETIENDYILHNFYVRAPDWQGHYGTVFENETDKVRIDDYYSETINMEVSKKVSLVFDASGFAEGTVFTVKYGLKEDLSDALTITTKEAYITIDNLLSGTTYYWEVSADNVSSGVNYFTTDEGFRMITADGVNNIRDMGGRRVYGNKRIKQGLIFRGAEIVDETYVDTNSNSTHYKTLNDENMRILRDVLGIKYQIDFRGNEEANNITESVLKDENHSDIEYLRIPNMSAYDRLIASDDAEEWALVKQMFLAFKNAEEKPVYFHCWGGADRTGTAGFLLGGLLGMSFTDLVIDFELTSFSKNYRPHYANDAKKVYRFPSLIYRLTDQDYYTEDMLISDLIAQILIEKAGLTAQDIADIKAALLEDC